MKRIGNKNEIVLSTGGIPFLLYYGIPALLVLCVVSGVGVLIALICRARKAGGAQKQTQEKPEPEQGTADTKEQ